MVAVAAVSFSSIDNGLDQTIGHAETDDAKGVPETSVKHNVAGVPDPFKTNKGKHSLSSFFDYALAGCKSPVSSAASSTAAEISSSMGFSSASWGKIGR